MLKLNIEKLARQLIKMPNHANMLLNGLNNSQIQEIKSLAGLEKQSKHINNVIIETFHPKISKK